MHRRIYYISAALLFTLALPLAAQSERSLLNDGIEQYKEKKYADSEVSFKKSVEKNGEFGFHSNYNLGDALYKQGRYDEAAQYFQNSLQYAKEDRDLSAKALYNIGNSFVKKEKYKEAVEAYKNSLKLNPKDAEAKYNLSYALEKLKQQQNQNQQNKNDQNKDQNKDQKKDDQQKDQEKNNQDKKQDQDKNEQNKQQDQQNQPQPKKNEISKEQAEQILNAFKNNEAELQKNLRKKKGAVIKTDKDW